MRPSTALLGSADALIFDVFSIDGESVTAEPYRERRAILESLHLHGPGWRTPEAFEDGEAPWQAVCEHELEGVITKRRASRYASGERGRVKVKNRDYWRYEMEREGAFKARERQFI